MKSTVFFNLQCSMFNVKQRVNKLTLVKQLEVFHLLAETNILHRHLQLVGDANDDSALGGTI